MKCTVDGNHSADYLKVIYSDGPEMERRVVRWCSECGAVVVDEDSDGRIHPGGYIKMMFPKNRCQTPNGG